MRKKELDEWWNSLKTKEKNHTYNIIMILGEYYTKLDEG